jgi:HPt (histidine-containing phosphotransfer) domain-containing protein
LSRSIEATFRQKQGELAAVAQNVPLTISMIGFAAGSVCAGKWVIAMPLHLERIAWMPSPPLAPDDGPIDMDHLQRMTLGDAGLQREVLTMFSAQAASLIGNLATLPADARALAHTLKGSARAIGAFGVADAAGHLEVAVLNGYDPSEALSNLDEAIVQARIAIDAILRGS